MKNTGKPSEEIFDNYWKALGKSAFVFAFTDASEARGTNNRHVTIKAQPSDRIVTCSSGTFYAEVKSTMDPIKFSFSLLRKTQSSFAKQIIKAKGEYNVFIHSIPSDKWYWVPYSKVLLCKELGRGSLKWAELTQYEWEMKC